MTGVPLAGFFSRAIARDVASAYLASAARVGSWLIISGLLFRWPGKPAMAVLALVRGVVGILGYVSAGLVPAVVRALAGGAAENSTAPSPAQIQDLRSQIPSPKSEIQNPKSKISNLQSPISNPESQAPSPPRVIVSSAMLIAAAAGAIGLGLLFVYAFTAQRLHRIPPALCAGEIPLCVLGMGIGVIFRVLSDPPGALLQARQRIVTDNLIVAAGEATWVILAAGFLVTHSAGLSGVAAAYAVSGVIVLVGRHAFAGRIVGLPSPRLASRAAVRTLLGFAALVTFGQFADFLYAPTDYIIINRFIADASAVADYAPAVQITTGLLLIAAALAAVLLPRAAVAHAGQDAARIRRYYLRGTAASLVLMLAASGITWAAAPSLLRLWLGRPMPATLEILPYVLTSTILGGSGLVGLSLLLAIGKARAYTASVIISGLLNAGSTFFFVAGLDLGLKGIALGSIVAVTARCGFWLPWYLNRSLKEMTSSGPGGEEPPMPT